jgi:hypothetical protein
MTQEPLKNVVSPRPADPDWRPGHSGCSRPVGPRGPQVGRTLWSAVPPVPTPGRQGGGKENGKEEAPCQGASCPTPRPGAIYTEVSQICKRAEKWPRPAVETADICPDICQEPHPGPRAKATGGEILITGPQFITAGRVTGVRAA